MGLLVNGVWQQNDVRVGDDNSKGEFLRQPVTFRSRIEVGGRFPPEKNRYHLYVSFACPWAHRVLIMRAIKGLEPVISVDVVSPNMMEDGWSFQKDFDGIPNDSLYGFDYLRDIYLKADPNFTGRVTVPVLWDKVTGTIVNNESSEIMRFLNHKFSDFSDHDYNYYQESLQPEIDKWNDLIYENVNNGVYRCGFARSQSAYDQAYKNLFETLAKLESRLHEAPYFTGEKITEVELRLFPTLIRFDTVYNTHFKCNGRLISQYPNLSRLVKEIRKMPAVETTINMKHIKQHYYYSHTAINPSRIVPLGPLV